jgi:hypothetical protein
MRQRSVIVLASVVALATPCGSSAQTLAASAAAVVERVPLELAVSESAPADPSALATGQQSTEQGATSPPPRAFEYSDGYHTRAKIHHIASFATLPLFVTQGILGESIYNNPTDAKRTAHKAVGVGIGGLFALNSTLGVWNLLEARKDPNFPKRRLVHGLLMLGSDAGFVATFATSPSPDYERGNPAAHRALAFTSIGLATTGYLIMLFGGH